MPNPDPALCRDLAADLAAAGLRSSALRDAWGAEADDAVRRGLRTPGLRALADRDDALATLARLLTLGRTQPTEAVDRALPTARSRGLVALGLAQRDGDLVRPVATIRPQDSLGAEWWIVAGLDELASDSGALAEDFVLGVGRASLTLAGLQLPTPAGRVLDLGTGCGIQALVARQHADAVVATDISEPALACARLTALLNGASGIETRRGSLFDPVAGETFDRIVSNPPFVITPRTADVPAYEYRDGGLVGDALVEQVVRGAGEHLVPGGACQLLGNWETRDGVDGLDRVRAWVESSPVPLDAWVIERERLDPIAYAEMWIRDGGTVPGSPAHDRLLGAWLDDFAERGVTAVGFGYVLLRRAAGAPTLARYERIPQPIPDETALGAHLADALAVHDALAVVDDEALANATLRVAPDVTEARHHMPGEENPTLIELRQGAGFGRSVQADPALAGLVGASDGELTVGQIVGALAQLLEVDEEALSGSVLPAVRALLVDGFLRFA
ncbi:DUF7059 domain-containing protein [Microbacterium sp. gxy059]|uniref:DUF7059 domain-containing protein n=1 Tax=Microbacterium sp. gxy059 TaxID=2957199 RepID=UPI003D975342